MQKWRCTVCGYIYYGVEPPDFCPPCGAPKEAFELLSGGKNKLPIWARKDLESNEQADKPNDSNGD